MTNVPASATPNNGLIKPLGLLILCLYTSFCSANETIYFYYIGGDNNPVVKVMNAAITQIPNYRLSVKRAPESRIDTMINAAGKQQIHCDISLFSTINDRPISATIWSKVILLNPDTWVIAYHKGARDVIQKYIDADGYFDLNLSNIDFKTDDLRWKSFTLLRDPALKGGYGYEFPDGVPADIVNKTHRVKTANGGEQIIRMIDKGRIDVSPSSAATVQKTIKKWQLNNVKILAPKLDAQRFKEPFYQIGLRCGNNQIAQKLIVQFDKWLEQVRGTTEFIHSILDGAYPEQFITNTLLASAALRRGEFDQAYGNTQENPDQ